MPGFSDRLVEFAVLKFASIIGVVTVFLSVADNLQLAALLSGFVVIGAAGVLSVRAKSADLWHQAYDAEKALHESKILEFMELKRHLTEAQARIAVYEQAPKYEDIANMFRDGVSAMTAEHNAILEGMQQISAVLGRMETRLTPSEEA